MTERDGKTQTKTKTKIYANCSWSTLAPLHVLPPCPAPRSHLISALWTPVWLMNRLKSLPPPSQHCLACQMRYASSTFAYQHWPRARPDLVARLSRFAASSLISLNFTNCQLCALVNIFIWLFFFCSIRCCSMPTPTPSPTPGIGHCSLLLCCSYLLLWLPICFVCCLCYKYGRTRWGSLTVQWQSWVNQTKQVSRVSESHK